MNCVFSAWGDVLGSVAEGTQAVAGSGALCRAQIRARVLLQSLRKCGDRTWHRGPRAEGAGAASPTRHRGRPLHAGHNCLALEPLSSLRNSLVTFTV